MLNNEQNIISLALPDWLLRLHRASHTPGCCPGTCMPRQYLLPEAPGKHRAGCITSAPQHTQRHGHNVMPIRVLIWAIDKITNSLRVELPALQRCHYRRRSLVRTCALSHPCLWRYPLYGLRIIEGN